MNRESESRMTWPMICVDLSCWYRHRAPCADAKPVMTCCLCRTPHRDEFRRDVHACTVHDPCGASILPSTSRSTLGMVPRSHARPAGVGTSWTRPVSVEASCRLDGRGCLSNSTPARSWSGDDSSLTECCLPLANALLQGRRARGPHSGRVLGTDCPSAPRTDVLTLCRETGAIVLMLLTEVRW